MSDSTPNKHIRNESAPPDDLLCPRCKHHIHDEGTCKWYDCGCDPAPPEERLVVKSELRGWADAMPRLHNAPPAPPEERCAHENKLMLEWQCFDCDYRTIPLDAPAPLADGGCHAPTTIKQEGADEHRQAGSPEPGTQQADEGRGRAPQVPEVQPEVRDAAGRSVRRNDGAGLPVVRPVALADGGACTFMKPCGQRVPHTHPGPTSTEGVIHARSAPAGVGGGEIQTDSITADMILHGNCRREIAALRARVEEWKRAVEGLTPGGSEFVNDPAACAAFIREQRERDTKAIGERNTKNRELRARVDELERVIEDAEHGRWCMSFNMPPEPCDCFKSKAKVSG